MSDEHQEQSAASTTELDESQGSLGIGYDPDDASNYAKEVNALLYADETAETETEEESPEEEATEEAQEEEATTEETEEESEEEEEEQPKAARYRIKAKNDVERTALALHKANPNWTLEQSIDAAKKLHPDTTAQVQSNEEQEESLDSIESQIAELKAKKREAIKEFDGDLQVELEDQIDALKDKRIELSAKQKAREISEEQTFYAEANNYAKQATDYYPDSANPNSALAKEMARIDADLIATDNPLIYDPKKAFRVTQMAANNLGIAPRSQTKSVVVKKVTTRPALQPSSGSTRSTTAAAPILDALANPDMSLAEYEAMIGSMS